MRGVGIVESCTGLERESGAAGVLDPLAHAGSAIWPGALERSAQLYGLPHQCHVVETSTTRRSSHRVT